MVPKEAIEDIDPEPRYKRYNEQEESHKSQIEFDRKVTKLGMIIILFYLFVVGSAFVLHSFDYCKNCYPEFLKSFELLVLVLIGFFFGTRIVPYYHQKK